MNGYLHNLTMRTLDLGNRVEPRLPSLFEAQPFERGPAFVREEDQQVEPVAAQAPVVNAPARQEITTERSKGAQIIVNEDRLDWPRPASPTQHRELGAVEAGALPVKLRSQTAQKTESPKLEENTQVESSTPRLERGGLAPLSPQSNVISTKTAPGRRTPRKGMETSEALISQKRALEVDQLPLQPDVEPPASIATVATPRSETNVNEAPEDDPFPTKTFRSLNPTPAAWRNAREQRRRPPTLGPVEPEPSINITIGRVEVRAVQTDPTKSSPRRSESPVMPLEEYLRKQRRGGQR